MGWEPMEPDYALCGMTNWVGSFDPIRFIYFMLATVLIPYPTYVFVATIFDWEHRAKRPARHYQDILHATSYGLIVFIFGNYAQTLNWITILAFWITWPLYSLIAELPFAKTSLPSWKSWPFGMYALFAGATAVVLAFAAYHIYLGVVLTRTVPGFVGYYLLGLLIPAALTLIGYACYKQQNNDLLGLSKVYKWILHLKWKRSNAVLTRKAKKQQEQLAAAAAAAQEAQKQPAIDPAASTDQNKAVAAAQAAGTVAIPVGPCGMDTPYSSQSNFASRTGSNDHLVRALDINSDTNHSQQSQTSLPGSSGPSGTLAPTNVAPTTASGDTIHNLCQPYIPNPTRSSPVDTLGDVNELTDINGQPQRTEPAATTTSIEIAEPAVVLPPYNPYVWTVTTAGYFHPHHWQLFYILAFFTRFDHWVSRVGGGIVLGCYMQGIMAYGFDPLIEE